MAWTGCQTTLEPEDNTETPVADKASVMTLTLEAGKIITTKALELALDNDGEKLNAFWIQDEEVVVFAPGSADSIGTLKATPKEDKTKATLSGDINVTGLQEGQTLTLLFPKKTWSYEGQSGRLLSDGNHPEWKSIEKDFDFARAEVTIKAITTNSITTSTADFENQQSIYRFGFRHGANGPTIRTKTVLLTSDRGQLARTVNAQTCVATHYATTEPMTIVLPVALTAAEANANALIYFALLNDNKTQDDTFSFTIYDDDGATFKGTKLIPQTALKYSFVTASNVGLARLELPQGVTGVETAL